MPPAALPNDSNDDDEDPPDMETFDGTDNLLADDAACAPAVAPGPSAEFVKSRTYDLAGHLQLRSPSHFQRLTGEVHCLCEG